MSEGLKALLEAAQFIEQQEKLKLSPQAATAIPAILNEQQQRFIVQATYDATLAAAASTTTTSTTISVNNSNNNSANSINGINIRSSNIRHGSSSGSAASIHQVSSSAPAAAATFQHVNGHQHHNNSTSLHHHTPTTVLTNDTTTTPIATTTNGHHSHVPASQSLNFNNHHHPQQQQQQNSQLLNANHHDYEFNGIANGGNGVGVTIITANTPQQQHQTISSSSMSSLSGRSSESSRIMTDESNNNNKNSNKNNNNNASIMLLTNNPIKTNLSTTMSSWSSSSPSPSLSPPVPMATDEDEIEPNKILDKSQAENTPMDTTTDVSTANSGGGGIGATTTFTLIGSNGEILGNAAASKQVLLANGIRIAAAPQQQVALSKSINIPSFNSKSLPVITGFSYQLPASLPSSTSLSQQTITATQSPQQQLQSQLSGHGGGNINILTNRHKTFIPLTPPPMSSRKFVEPAQSRIRSFSLSSHKFSANNQHHHHNNNNNSMMVDDIPPTSSHQQQHSPPRHVSSSLGSSSGGSHYMQMISTAAAGQQQTTVGVASISNHVAHATPRRRTISSTSNGAGTREVHNKLEKNRRAHLKECYEQLKNELSLKDEDRRKTSNLAILGEALKCVQYLNNRNHEVDAEWEHLANEKINLQKRFVSLKRELGPKYEQIFSGIFPDNEIGSIPNERENINDTHSLASGRGSALYSSSSSLSSGGSNGSSSSNGGSGNNTMSSPVGAGLQTAMPTTISPVINKINNNINSNTSPISISNNNVAIQQQQQQQRKNAINTTTTLQAVAIPATHQGSSGGVNISSPQAAGSPTALITFGSSLPLSLTAKNISATAVTRGSPTPSTPSPSPSSSSGVSSSSSLISSSPPINGVISNGRNVTVNIPNGLKLHATGAGPNTGTATILATSAPAQGVNNTNNVLANHQQYNHNGRKKSLTLSSSNSNSNIHNNATNTINHMVENHEKLLQTTNEDGEQPAKFLKVFNTTTTTTTAATAAINGVQQNYGQKLFITSNGDILTNCGSGSVVGGGLNNNNNNNNNNGGSTVASSPSSSAVVLVNKTLSSNSNSSTILSTPTSSSISATATSNELCRLPGGAELNILPTNGLKIATSNSLTGPVATAFYHANGKITFVNGPPNHHHHHQQHQFHHQHNHTLPQQHPPSSLPNSTTITSNGATTTLTSNGLLLKDSASGGVTPILVSAATSPSTSSVNSGVNGLHFTGNFAQLIAAASNTNANNNNSNAHSNETSINTSASASATASILPMAMNFQNIAEPKLKTNSKSSILTWRSGAATTN